MVCRACLRSSSDTKKRALAAEWNEIPLYRNTRKCHPFFFHRPIRPYVYVVCMLYYDILVSSLDHCNWNEPNSSNWTKFYQESFLSLLLEERRMSRWYFISVECDGNDFKMILRSYLPTSQATSWLNRVKTTTIAILYSPHVPAPASIRSRNLVHDLTSKAQTPKRLIWRYIVSYDARFQSNS